MDLQLGQCPHGKRWFPSPTIGFSAQYDRPYRSCPRRPRSSRVPPLTEVLRQHC